MSYNPLKVCTVMSLGILMCSAMPVLSQSKSTSKGFPGFSSLWFLSMDKVIAKLGRPVVMDKQYTNESPWGPYKSQQLCYDNVAGAKRITLGLDNGKVSELYAAYAQKPTPLQLKILFGINGAVNVHDAKDLSMADQGEFKGNFQSLEIGAEDMKRFPTKDGLGFNEIGVWEVTSISSDEFNKLFNRKVGNYFVQAYWVPVMKRN